MLSWPNQFTQYLIVSCTEPLYKHSMAIWPSVHPSNCLSIALLQTMSHRVLIQISWNWQKTFTVWQKLGFSLFGHICQTSALWWPKQGWNWLFKMTDLFLDGFVLPCLLLAFSTYVMTQLLDPYIYMFVQNNQERIDEILLSECNQWCILR